MTGTGGWAGRPEPVGAPDDGGAPPAARRSWLHASALELGRVLVPQQCPGCGAWDVAVCGACRSPLDGPVRRVEAAAPRLDDALHGPLPTWGVAAYTGPVRAVVVAWKDRGRRDLGPVLGEAVRHAAAEVAPTLRAVTGGAELLVVPVPSAPGARRRRGGDLVADLARAAAQGLRENGQRARAEPLIVHRRGRVRDQVGLGARARGRNTARSFRLRPTTAARRWCVLVDDVLTTGSTLAACARLLTGAGAVVGGALVLAATPAPARAAEPVILSPGEPLPPRAAGD